MILVLSGIRLSKVVDMFFRFSIMSVGFVYACHFTYYLLMNEILCLITFKPRLVFIVFYLAAYYAIICSNIIVNTTLIGCSILCGTNQIPCDLKHKSILFLLQRNVFYYAIQHTRT